MEARYSEFHGVIFIIKRYLIWTPIVEHLL